MILPTFGVQVVPAGKPACNACKWNLTCEIPAFSN